MATPIEMHSLKKLSVKQFRSIIPLVGSNYSRQQYLCTKQTETDRTTHFGFKTVGESEKADKGLRRNSDKK